ncbi:ABC transporter ATP-binding protein [Turicibacter bilis]|uniref:ABC transporter ATP-binding protein n=1 Tax=Turicibacter bilis TaxID=2735723 RepID=A0A9Q9CI00_9FIRM|nr:ABC transporter ATP-binding protein [Turicibacter bilis]MBS3197436.1 ABC transporter ATP-binding protein [Turicibacter bilis]UUF09015.1 ABC transporter ATP-binding protein [Turicibacter bilis]
MSTILDMNHVYKDFYSLDEERQILKDINFSVEEGEILVLLGPSGCGKSTILNIISGLLEPTQGSVDTHGKKIGYMFQKDHLFEWRTIMKNITLGLEIQHKLTNEAQEEIKRLLEIYDLWDFRNNFPRELSGGMKQRVALIRTLALNPDILLLDESFSGLDYQTRLIVTDDIYKIIKNENKTAILVTHDISEAISLADKVAVLSHRPTTIQSVHKITLTLEGDKTPLTARLAPEFKDYFDLFWKELQNDEERI